MAAPGPLSPAALAFAALVALAPARALASPADGPRTASAAAPPRATAAAPRATAAPHRAVASARPKRGPVAWTSISAPSGPSQRALEAALRPLLEREAAAADWGRAAGDGDVEAQFALRRFERTLDRGVLRVHCSAAGRLRDGRPARSTFSLGGLPSERAALEKRALAFAVRGVVVRLAELARAAARPRVRVTNEPGEF